MANESGIAFPALTGIRTLAALMVYFFHFNPWKEIPFWGEIVNQFYISLCVFFVLSGFLVTYNYLSKGYKSFKTYFLFRITRIYPLFFVLTLFTYLFPAFYYQNFDSIFTFKTLADFSLTKALFGDFLSAGIIQTWTLTVEMCFYLLLPLMVFLWGRIKYPFFSVFFLIISFGAVIKLIGPEFLSYSFIPSWKFFFQITFFGRCFEFLVGVALAYSYQKFKKTPYLTLIGCLFIILSLILLKYTIPQDSNFGMDSPLGLMLNNVFVPLFGIAPLILGLIHEKTLFQRLLSTKIFRVLGRSSYAFYLVHMGIIQSYLFFALKLDPYSSLIILYTLAITLYHWFEKPVMIWLRKIAHKKNRTTNE